MKKLAKILAATALSATLCVGAVGFAACDKENGKSAYDIAVENGFQGTVTEWLESLKGANGTAGSAGTAGEQGKSAYDIAVEEGFEGTKEEWLESLKGSDGAAGAAGAAGATGATGAQGVGVKDISIAYTYKRNGKMYAVYTVTYTDDTTDTIEAEIPEATREQASLQRGFFDTIIWTTEDYQAFLSGNGNFAGLYWCISAVEETDEGTFLRNESVTQSDVLYAMKEETPAPDESGGDSTDSFAPALTAESGGAESVTGTYMIFFAYNGDLNSVGEEPRQIQVTVVEESFLTGGRVSFSSSLGSPDINGEVGDTLDKLLETAYLKVEYEGIGVRCLPVTKDMLDFGEGVTFSSAESTLYSNVKVKYGDGASDYVETEIYIYEKEEEPDMEKATIVKTLTGNAEKSIISMHMQGSYISKIELYDNGYAKVYMKLNSAVFCRDISVGEYMRYKLKDGVLKLEGGEREIVVIVNNEDNTFTDFSGGSGAMHLTVTVDNGEVNIYAYSNGIAEIVTDQPIGVDSEDRPIYFSYIVTYKIIEQTDYTVTVFSGGEKIVATVVPSAE